jgi:hypothetical protein
MGSRGESELSDKLDEANLSGDRMPPWPHASEMTSYFIR